MFRSTHLNQRVVESLTTLKRLMVFQREPLIHLIQLLMKEIKVKDKGINLVLIIFLLIMFNMVNFHNYTKRIAYSFYGLDNHNVFRCSKIMATYMRLLKERK